MSNKEYFKKFKSSKSKVLASLVSNGSASRKTLAAELGLTRAFLTKLTTKMLEEDLILTGPEMNEGKVGRKQIMLNVNSNKGYFLGIHIGVDHISIRCSKFNLEIVGLKRIDFKTLTNFEVDKAISFISEQCEKYNVHHFLAVSLLVRGSVINNQATNISVHNVKDRFEEKLHQEVHLINNIVALSAALDFEDKTGSDYILVKYGPGIGSLVISNSSILKKQNGEPVEIGHIQIDPNSDNLCEICHKKGCLEAEIGFPNLIKIASNGDVDSSDFSVLESYLDKNENLFKNAISTLTIFMSEAYDIFDPDMIFLAGEPFNNPKYRQCVYQAMHDNNLSLPTDKLLFIDNYIEISSKASIIYAFEQYLNNI